MSLSKNYYIWIFWVTFLIFLSDNCILILSSDPNSSPILTDMSYFTHNKHSAGHWKDRLRVKPNFPTVSHSHYTVNHGILDKLVFLNLALFLIYNFNFLVYLGYSLEFECYVWSIVSNSHNMLLVTMVLLWYVKHFTRIPSMFQSLTVNLSSMRG